MNNASWKNEFTKLRVVMIQDILHGARFNKERNFECFDELEVLIESALSTQQTKIEKEMIELVKKLRDFQAQAVVESEFENGYSDGVEEACDIFLYHLQPHKPQEDKLAKGAYRVSR